MMLDGEASMRGALLAEWYPPNVMGDAAEEIAALLSIGERSSILPLAGEKIIESLPVTMEAYEWALDIIRVADMLVSSAEDNHHVDTVTWRLFQKARNAMLAFQPAIDDPWNIEETAAAAGYAAWFFSVESNQPEVALGLIDVLKTEALLQFGLARESAVFSPEYSDIHQSRLEEDLQELRSSVERRFQ